MALTAMQVRMSWREKIVAIALALLIAEGPLRAEEPKPGTAAPGRLSIATEPAGAAVYVDGRAAGMTPLQIRSLHAGEHRVRVLKAGYLENARVVTIAPGRETPVTVKLTKSNATAGQVISGAGGDGLLSNKLFWIAVAGAGGAAGYVLATKNAAPVAGTISAPSSALMGAAVAFSSQGASDKDGDPLTLTWNFGDGGTATGERVTHAYATDGSFTVKLVISDGKKSAEAPPATVMIKSLSGTWRGTLAIDAGQLITVLNLNQNNTSVSGTYTDNATTVSAGPGSVTGAVNSSGTITLTVTVRGINPFIFTGTASADGNTLTGVVNGSGFVNERWSLTRS